MRVFADTVDYEVIDIRDDVAIRSRREDIGSTIVHVLDLSANDAHTFVTPGKGGFMRLHGSISLTGPT